MPTGLVVAPLSLSRSTCALESRITLYRTARELTLQTFVKSGGSHEPHLQAKVDLALVRENDGVSWANYLRVCIIWYTVYSCTCERQLPYTCCFEYVAHFVIRRKEG